MIKFRYKSIFMYASLQFCGNIEEYFSKNTEKLIVYIVMPRLKSNYNLLRVYVRGKLMDEKKVKTSENIFLYYIFWMYFHWKILLKYFTKKEKVYVIGGHPICFFGLTIQRIIRKTHHVYWIGDYFPGDGFVIKSFEKIKKHYHDRVKYRAYLSNEINLIFNKGKIVETQNRKTIMWGTKPSLQTKARLPKTRFNIFFAGIIREQQGLEFMFEIIKKNKNIFLYILGACEKVLYKKYKKIIKSLKIQKNVYFPNKNFYGNDLAKIASKSHIGIALYDEGQDNVTYYADPAKIKTYTQLGLPVLMTNTSPIAPFVKRFKAGLITSKNEKNVTDSIIKIRSEYPKFINGLKKFNQFFNYENYYKKKFDFLENH